MRDKYIDGEPKSIADNKVSEVISSAKLIQGCVGDWVIGIANEQGKLYRKIVVYGFGNYVNIALSLQEIGYIDLFANNAWRTKGLDSFFALDR